MVNGPSAQPAAAAVRCRQIAETDIEAVADLLTQGFAGRTREYWLRGLERQAARPAVPGCPRLGYMLESDGKPVGVCLVLCSSQAAEGGMRTRCNLSSWYVDPAFRGHAAMLSLMASKLKGVTYLNISPDPITWSTIEAQGFTRYSEGQFFSVPTLSRRRSGVRIEEVRADETRPHLLALPEIELLKQHAQYGCHALVCFARDGSAYPFVFLPFRIRRGRIPLPCMHLVYCRDVDDFVHHANPLGWHFIRRGIPFVILDALGPVSGLVGAFRSRGRKYFKGPKAPRLGDLSYTEFVLFGP